MTYPRRVGIGRGGETKAATGKGCRSTALSRGCQDGGACGKQARSVPATPTAREDGAMERSPLASWSLPVLYVRRVKKGSGRRQENGPGRRPGDALGGS